MTNAFGERLWELLLEHNMTQKQLAEESGVSQSTISQYITGKRCPTLASGIAIAASFKVPIEALLDEKCALNGVVKNVDDAVELILAVPDALSEEQRKRLLRVLVEL